MTSANGAERCCTEAILHSRIPGRLLVHLVVVTAHGGRERLRRAGLGCVETREGPMPRAFLPVAFAVSLGVSSLWPGAAGAVDSSNFVLNTTQDLYQLCSTP